MFGRRWGALWSASLVGIVLVDFGLGATAEYLNAYELVRQSLGLDLPRVADGFVVGQSSLGQLASALAWLAFLAEGALLSSVLTWLAGLARLPGKLPSVL